MLQPMNYRIAVIRIEDMRQQACWERLARTARRLRKK